MYEIRKLKPNWIILPHSMSKPKTILNPLEKKIWMPSSKFHSIFGYARKVVVVYQDELKSILAIYNGQKEPELRVMPTPLIFREGIGKIKWLARVVPPRGG